jgi:hemolysin activation/secretion protein
MVGTLYRARYAASAAILLIPVAATTVPAALAAPAAPVVPGNADAGRIIEELQPAPKPQLPAAPAVTVPPVPTAQPPAGAGQATVLLDHVTFKGVTAYETAALEAIFRPYYGQRVSLKTLYELANAVTRRYHADGYALSRAVLPPQRIADGTVHVRVIEGYIDTVETQGAYRETAAARGIVERIGDDRPLNMHHLERDLLLLGDLAGAPVRAVFTPAEKESGAVGLTLVFSDAPPQFAASADNLGSRYVGPYEAGVQAGFTLPFLPYQRTQLSALESIPANNLKTVQASHRGTLNSWGTTATLQAAYAHAEPGFRLTPEEIVSDAWNYGLAVSHPLIRSRAESLYLGGDLTVKDITTDALNTTLYHDRLTIAGLSAQYALADRWGGANLARVKLAQGLDALGARPTGSPDLSRADGQSDFTKIGGDISRLQRLTDTVRLYVAAEGQYAWSPLLSSEQFGFGGQQFGRAYDASELTGDDGIAAAAELRYALPPVTPRLAAEGFVFYDIGRVWNYHAAGSAESAASAGLGVRFAVGDHLSGVLTLAQPLTRRVAAPDWGNGKDPRGFFSLMARF